MFCTVKSCFTVCTMHHTTDAFHSGCSTLIVWITVDLNSPSLLPLGKTAIIINIIIIGITGRFISQATISFFTTSHGQLNVRRITWWYLISLEETLNSFDTFIDRFPQELSTSAVQWGIIQSEIHRLIEWHWNQRNSFDWIRLRF